MSTASNTGNELLKLLATTAVTVLTSYQAITSHIDATVASEVQASTTAIYHHLDRVRAHADSLHQVTQKEIRLITDSLPVARIQQVTF